MTTKTVRIQKGYPEKYTSLLDAQMWAFIEETARWYPADAVGWDVHKQRAVYNDLCKAFSFPHPDGVSTRDEEFSHKGRKVGLRHYEMRDGNRRAHVLYFHGGGFVVGGLESHDSICADLCAATGLSITAVDYALAPEHHFPADYEDCLASFELMSSRLEVPLILCGDSAGANLCASVSQTTKLREKRPRGQVLIYPGLGSDVDHGSFNEHSHAPGITQADTRYYKGARVGGDFSLLERPECCPLNASDFSDLPPTYCVVAECDPLKDDGIDYCAAVNAAGGKAVLVEEPGLIHGYLRARNSVDKARESFARIVAALEHFHF